MSSNVIKAILIDDTESYGFELIGLAAEYTIEITHYNNLQNAIEENPKLLDINFIILDAHCLIEEESTVPDFDFLPSALLDIETIQNNIGRKIPLCINTGYSEEKKLNRYRDKIKIFNKTSDQEKLFTYIIEVVKNDDEFQFKFEHSEVFELFELGLLSVEHKLELVEVYKTIKTSNSFDIKSTFRRMRPIIEASLKKLKEHDTQLIPDGYFQTGEPNISGIIYYLSGKPKFNKDKKMIEYYAEQIFPEHITDSLDALYDITSKAAMHDYNKGITPYIVKSCFFSLLEYLVWFKRFYLKNYL